MKKTIKVNKVLNIPSRKYIAYNWKYHATVAIHKNNTLSFNFMKDNNVPGLGNAMSATNTATNDETDQTQDTKEELEIKAEKVGVKDLFRPMLIALRTANMFYQWFAVTLVYYGLSYSSTDLAGDPYTNFCSSVAIEIPGNSCFFIPSSI